MFISLLEKKMNPFEEIKMTLHDAIVQVLREKNREMTRQEIADEINERKLYSKKDGTPVTAFQIHGRTKNYPALFTRNGSLVGLVEWNAKPTRLPDKVHHPINSPAISWIEKEVTTTTFLEKTGFCHIGIIQTFFSSGLPSLPILDNCGLYAISMTKDYKPMFLSPENLKRKNVLRPWPVQKLIDKWVDNVDIVYYGIAGDRSLRSLRERLTDLINHGSGKTSNNGPHKGGEILWQLVGCEEFSVWVKSTGVPPEPRHCERLLLKYFYNSTGKLPFANRKH